MACVETSVNSHSGTLMAAGRKRRFLNRLFYFRSVPAGVGDTLCQWQPGNGEFSFQMPRSKALQQLHEASEARQLPFQLQPRSVT